ncbi:aldo/keto reductase [Streptosporangium canum]|uniref:aldo/keto reductase n=1 Tax=Streptosporangium canum TaxID=324952 RepID=UPI003F4C3CE2
MNRRRLGQEGPEVSAIGLGCMGMSEFYGAADEAESVEVIHRALDLGVTFLDTANMRDTLSHSWSRPGKTHLPARSPPHGSDQACRRHPAV